MQRTRSRVDTRGEPREGGTAKISPKVGYLLRCSSDASTQLFSSRYQCYRRPGLGDVAKPRLLSTSAGETYPSSHLYLLATVFVWVSSRDSRCYDQLPCCLLWTWATPLVDRMHVSPRSCTNPLSEEYRVHVASMIIIINPPISTYPEACLMADENY